ncbi:DUF805 domain containing protein [Sulfitobacter noctilucae]|uniref:DUF805 domain-containing protein n=1 Tax=Sulfitobacter noctilucae TaxID=1342302 RepID=UPI0004698CC4|nr:DUF805 domain-containing protein [Sulfitobacter noctilucae]KIN70706.1 DUF805 domain containing protein [Sulfitobacter noctilucae]
MKEFFSNYENFAFRAFKFQSRATLFEYWAVVPVIWFFIFITLKGDVQEVYGFLVNRTIPPLSPLYYESAIIFLITLIPRLSLNMRRLHDRNKTGFLVLLPAISMISGLVLMCGLLGAMMQSSLTGISDGPDEIGNIIHPVMLFLFAPEAFWQEMFAIAQAFQTMGSEAVSSLLAEIYAHSGAVDVRREVRSVTTEIEGESGHTFGFVFVAGTLVITPFLTAALHTLINILPSYTQDNIYGPAVVSALQYKKKKDNKNNPFAGYAHLFEETAEEQTRRREAGAEEVKALYRQRVLGQNP